MSCPHGRAQNIFECFFFVRMALKTLFLQVSSCPHGPTKNIFEWFLVVHIALQKTFLGECRKFRGAMALTIKQNRRGHFAPLSAIVARAFKNLIESLKICFCCPRVSVMHCARNFKVKGCRQAPRKSLSYIFFLACFSQNFKFTVNL